MRPSELLNELLSMPNDGELCDGVDSLIDKRFCKGKVDLAVPEPARTVMLVWYSMGVIGNGGFRYLFESGANADSDISILTIDSYRRIGATKAHEAFADALRLFSGGLPPTDVDERISTLNTLPDDAFREIDIRFYKATGNGQLETALARFIRENRDELARVLDEEPKEV